MAPLPTITDTFRLTWDWTVTGGGNIAENVIHVRKASSTSAAAAAAVNAALQSNQFAACASATSFNTTHVTPLDGSSATSVIPVTGPYNQGEGSGDLIPQASAIVSLHTAKRGRSYRGRIFLPFIAESTSGNGLLGSVYQNEMQTAWNAFLAALTTAGFPLVVASYKHATAEPVTSCLVKLGLATQRRRQTRISYP